MLWYVISGSFCFITILLCIMLLAKLNSVKRQLGNITEALNDIKSGNGNRRILTSDHKLTSALSFKINDIIYAYEERIARLQAADDANRQLMTSLSHDIRTPLTTLLGYLDAVHKGIVNDKEQKRYIEVARRKAHDLKDYIDVLFDWFKLNSSEFTLTIEHIELSELTRNILKDWIPIFEENNLHYDITLPEKSIMSDVDIGGYTRILNNLIQNVLSHSQATKINIEMSNTSSEIIILVKDNGIGIEKSDITCIFNRLYKCDKGRSHKGSGLGLAIARQLSEEMNGRILVESLPNHYTVFSIFFPLKT